MGHIGYVIIILMGPRICQSASSKPQPQAESNLSESASECQSSSTSQFHAAIHMRQ